MIKKIVLLAFIFLLVAMLSGCLSSGERMPLVLPDKNESVFDAGFCDVPDFFMYNLEGGEKRICRDR